MILKNSDLRKILGYFTRMLGKRKKSKNKILDKFLKDFLQIIERF